MEKSKLEDIFSISPEIEDLTNFAQYESSIKVPTREGTSTIVLALLWEGEELDIIKKSSKDINAQDMLARSEYIKIETLVLAIKKIGDSSFYSDDEDENVNLKNKLRSILSISSPILIEYIFNRYSDLVAKRNEFVEQQTEELKKNFLLELNDIKPL